MEISIKKLDSGAILPRKGTLHSAGIDLYALYDATIPAFGSAQVRTGIAIGWSDPLVYLQLHSRSGLFFKNGITCEAGVIDWDYLKEIVVGLQNHTVNEYHVTAGERIAQGVFISQPMISRMQVVDDWISPGTTYLPYLFSSREGGLGSTGK